MTTFGAGVASALGWRLYRRNGAGRFLSARRFYEHD